MAKLYFFYGAMNSGKTTRILKCDYNYVEDDYGIDEYGDKIKHKRTKIFDSSLLEENDFIKFKKKKYKKAS